MKGTWKKLMLTALSATLIASAPETGAQAASDSNALAGFSFLFDKYITENDTTSKKSEEAVAKLFSSQTDIPDNVVVAKVIDSCNIREGAGTNYNIIAIFPKNAYGVLLEQTPDGWAKIKSGNVTGYIKTDYLYMGEEGYQKASELAHLTATVTAGVVNVRTKPSTTDMDSVIMEVTRGEQLDVIEDGIINKNDPKAQLWVKVMVDSSDVSSSDEDMVGYVSAEYVNVGYNWKTAVKIDPIDASVSAIRRKVITEAKKYIGLKYVWGGMSLKTGADCSGFCHAIYKACGISTKKLPRTSYDMAASSNGKTVSLANAKPGDLVFYGDKQGHVNHVGIYIGNNQVIHESGRKDGCKISKVNYRTIIKIKNFIDYIY